MPRVGLDDLKDLCQPDIFCDSGLAIALAGTHLHEALSYKELRGTVLQKVAVEVNQDLQGQEHPTALLLENSGISHNCLLSLGSFHFCPWFFFSSSCHCILFSHPAVPKRDEEGNGMGMWR